MTSATWEWRLDHLQNREIKVESLRLARDVSKKAFAKWNLKTRLVSICLFYLKIDI